MSTVEELGEEIAGLSAHLDAAAHRLLTCIREFDEQSGWYVQGAVSCADWLAWRVGLDLVTAREKVRVARALGKLPAIDEGLRTARLSYAKVRALTRVATPENEAAVLELALHATGAQLERICRGYRSAQTAGDGPVRDERCLRRRLLASGMVKLEIVLAPDEAELVLRALDHARKEQVGADDSAEARTQETAGAAGEDDVCESSAMPSRVDGVIALAESFLAGKSGQGSGSGGDRYQVMVHVEQEMLAPDGTLGATLDDHTHVSPESLRRIACDCGLVVGVAAGQGESLNLGRKTRSIPPALRRALQARDRGCAFPGCCHSRFLHGHHIRHWLHGGETSMGNLVLLCTAHHHRVHEGGWKISRSTTGELVFTSPTNEVLPSQPSRQRIEDALTWLGEWAAERGLDLGPDANEPLWDGTRPDYDYAVSALLAAQGAQPG